MENIVAYLDTLYFGVPALIAILVLLIWYIYGAPIWRSDQTYDDWDNREYDALVDQGETYESGKPLLPRNYTNLNPQWRRLDLGEAGDW